MLKKRRQTERSKAERTEQNIVWFSKTERFTIRTIYKSTEIRTFGFWKFTVHYSFLSTNFRVFAFLYDFETKVSKYCKNDAKTQKPEKIDAKTQKHA